MLPGPSPFKELAESLEHVAVERRAPTSSTELARGRGASTGCCAASCPSGGQLLLVVDQLEELFTTSSEADQRAFLDGLVAGHRGARQPAARRWARSAPTSSTGPSGCSGSAPRSARPRHHPGDGAGGARGGHRRARPPRRPAGRGRAGRRARRRRRRTSPPRSPRSSSRCTSWPSAGPGPLTLAAYRALGGVTGAITSRAEQLYRSLDDDERDGRAPRLRAAGGDQPGRRAHPATCRAGGAGPRPGRAVGRPRDRSMGRRPAPQPRPAPADPRADRRGGPRGAPARVATAARWIDDDRDVLVALGQLREAAAGWDALDRDPGALYRGARLQVALDATASRPPTLAERSASSCDASREARDAEEHAGGDGRGVRQVRVNRRLRGAARGDRRRAW